MSRLVDTQRAYDRISQLLDQEMRNRKGSTTELERFRQTLDVAFYLLGWAQFEYLVRKEAEDQIEAKAKGHTVERHAWNYLKANLKGLAVRLRLDIIFHGNPVVRNSLDKDYTLRNEAAHDYKLPKEAKDISGWLKSLEKLVDDF